MKITDLHVDSFGHWHGLEVNNLSDQITVICGPNEAGKTTLLHFIRAVLYGFSPQRHVRFVPPVFGGQAGGTVVVNAPNGRFQIRRHLKDDGRLRDDSADELSVRTVDGSVQGRHILSNLMSGVDETIYNNVFAVGLSEIQHLATLSDTEAAEQLYGLAMGTDRVSLFDVCRELEESRQCIVGDKNQSKSEIGRLQRQRADLKTQVVRSSEANQKWLQSTAELSAVNSEIDRLESQKKQHVFSGNPAEMVQQLRQQWRRCREVQSQLSKIGPTQRIPADALRRTETLTKEISAYRQKWESIRAQREKLRKQARGISPSRDLTAHAEEIRILGQKRNWSASLDEDIRRLRTQVDELEFELQGELEQFGVKLDGGVDTLANLNDQTISILAGPAREAQAARQYMDQLEKHAQQQRAEADRIAIEVGASLAKFNGKDILKSIQDAGDKVATLRGRIQADTTLDRVTRHLREVQKECRHWQAREVLPWNVLLTLGTVFSVGGMLVLISLFHDFFKINQANGWLLMIIGALTSIASLVIKNAFEYSATSRLEGCQRDVTNLVKQKKQAEKERDGLDRKLPPGSGPLINRLQTAEGELVELEKLLPMERKRSAEVAEANGAEQQHKMAKERLRNARDAWRATLQSLGLPETITPTQFAQLSGQTSAVSSIRRRLLDARNELEKKERELGTMRSRVSALVAETGIDTDDDRVEHHIDRLTKAVGQVTQHQRKRTEMHEQWRRLGKDQERIARSASRLKDKRRELVARYGVAGTTQLQALVKRSTQSLSLKQEKKKLIAGISKAFAGTITPDDVLGCLRDIETMGPDNSLTGQSDLIEDRIHQLENDSQDISSRLAQLHERRGELTAQLKTHVDDRTLGKKLFELSAIDERIHRAIKRWQLLAGTSHMLDGVRRSYETDRQPETLAEASGYLQRLTQGKYTRIWTPFGESKLCVDDRSEQALPIEVLSRGTREQVFLSLRLALTAAYGRRGARLPLVLDDVFVNFDAERARAAAETIRDFATAGHQVLIFTCHDHIVDTFRNLGVDVRSLPQALDIANQAGPDAAANDTDLLPEDDRLPAYIRRRDDSEFGAEEFLVEDGFDDEDDGIFTTNAIYFEHSPNTALPERPSARAVDESHGDIQLEPDLDLGGTFLGSIETEDWADDDFEDAA